MAIFIVIPTSDSNKIEEWIKRETVDLPFYKLPKGEFLVSFKGTTKELSDKLGISDGSSGSAIVTVMGNYFGWATTDIWEWINVNWGG